MSRSRTLPPFLAHLEWVLLLGALAAVVLVYPLQLQDVWLEAWTQFWRARPGPLAEWVQRQLNPLMGFMFQPLVLKGVVAAVPMAAFVAVHAARRLLRPFVAAPPDPHAPQPVFAWLWFAAFFAWTTASGFWGPTPAVSREAARWAALWGVFGWVLLRRGLIGRELWGLAGALMAIGTAVLAVLFMQALPWLAPWSSQFLHRFAESARNLHGSTLGHNTAAASFLLMTAFPALAVVVSAPRRSLSMAAGAYLALLVPAIVIVQSRAIWILGLLLGAAAARSMLGLTRTRRRRWIATLLLGAGALGLASQAIDRPWNPFYVRDNPLARRLRDLTPERLLKESRLRLNVLGAQLVPEAPIAGHGLYTFQYLYPRRQGEYFWEHPESRLGQTQARSHMAHNEYLQVAIEQGLIGLALLIGLLAEAARRGWRVRQRLHPPDRLLHEAFGWSALGFVLHALVDFPFHVPQLALPGLLCLAAWGARTDERAAPTGSDPPPVTKRFRPAAFARLLGAMGCFVALPLVLFPFVRLLQGDVFFNQGNRWLLSIGAPGATLTTMERVQRIDAAIRAFQTAVRLVPGNGLAWYGMGDAYRVLGMLQAAQGMVDGRPDPDSAARAKQFFERGLEALDEAARHTDFAQIHYYRAQIFRELARLEPAAGHDRSYIRNLELALRYTPTAVDVAQELAEALAAYPNPDVEKIARVRRLIRLYDPARFDRLYVMPAYAVLRDRCYERASQMWERIVQVDPDHSEWLNAAAMACFYAGERVRAAQLLDRLRRIDPNARYANESGLIEAALQERWFGVLEELAHMGLSDPRATARFYCIEALAKGRLGREDSTPWFKRPEAVSEAEWDRLVAEERPAVLYYFGRDAAAAARAAHERLAMDAEDPPVAFWIEAVRIGHAASDAALVRLAWDRLRAAAPDHPAVADLAARLGLPAGE